MRSVLAWVAILMLCRAGSAAPAADADHALQAFLDAAAAKQLGPEVVAFIAPAHDRDRAIADLDQLAAIVGKPQLKIAAINLAPSGTAAWIVAQLWGARYSVDGERPVTAPLRASAFLSRDGGRWHVRAVHLSAGTPNGSPQPQMCNSVDPGYEPPLLIADGAEPASR